MQKHFSITTSGDDIASAAILKDIVFGLADEMLDFKEAVEMRQIKGLDYRFSIPSQTSLTPQDKGEGGRADFQNLTWYDVSGTLNKYQTAMLFTDETKARQTENIQVATAIEAAATGLAQKKDTNIAEALVNGAANSFAATAQWDDEVDANPAQDIADAIGRILTNTNIPTSKIADIKLYYPAAL